MTCTVARGVAICRPSDRFLRKRYLRCPVCMCTTETVIRFEAWYDPAIMCCRCGDSWGGGTLADRPFYRHWRRDAVRVHRRLWDRATHGPDPTVDDLFPELEPLIESDVPHHTPGV